MTEHVCPHCGEPFESAAGLGGHKSAHDGPSRDELLSVLNELESELDRVPTLADINEHTEFTTTVYEGEFGRWTTALRLAGYEETAAERSASELLDPETLLQELKRVATILGRPPSADEFREFGDHSIRQYRGFFGSWREAKEAAGLDPDYGTLDPDREELIEEIQRLVQPSDTAPARTSLSESRFYRHHFDEEFGSWTTAVEAAGYEPNRHYPTSEELLADFNRLTSELGHPPTKDEIKMHSTYSYPSYRREFGSMEAVLSAGGYSPEWSGSLRSSVSRNNEQWTRNREAAIQRDGGACIVCGLSREEHQERYGSDIHVHHRTPISEFDSFADADRVENLATLCCECHVEYEDTPLTPFIEAADGGDVGA